MTTVVRQGDTIYTDSCYGTPVGTERTRVFGNPKFFINSNKTFLTAICGNIPSGNTCQFLTGMFSERLEHYLGNYMSYSPNRLTDIVENFYRQYLDVNPSLSEFFTIIFFTKDITFQINVKANKDRITVRSLTYGQHKDLAFGSGAAWWLAQKELPELSVLEKFNHIYALDINSGGTVNAFDLNQLKEIKV